MVYRGASHGLLGIHRADIERDVRRWLDRYFPRQPRAGWLDQGFACC